MIKQLLTFLHHANIIKLGDIMNAFQLTNFINTTANFIACHVDDDDELNLLSAIFTQLGDTLVTISAQRSICNKSNKSSDSF